MLIRPLRWSSLSLHATGHHCMPRDITVCHGMDYSEFYLFEERVFYLVYLYKKKICRSVCQCVCLCLFPKIVLIDRLTPKSGFILITGVFFYRQPVFSEYIASNKPPCQRVTQNFEVRLIRPLRRSSLSLYATRHHCMPRDMPRDITVCHGTSLYATGWIIQSFTCSKNGSLSSIYIYSLVRIRWKTQVLHHNICFVISVIR